MKRLTSLDPWHASEDDVREVVDAIQRILWHTEDLTPTLDKEWGSDTLLKIAEAMDAFKPKETPVPGPIRLTTATIRLLTSADERVETAKDIAGYIALDGQDAHVKYALDVRVESRVLLPREVKPQLARMGYSETHLDEE